MSKKVPIYLSEDELEDLIRAIEGRRELATYGADISKDWGQDLEERLQAELDTFEPDMYKEDKDGYETLTEEAKEGLRENEAWLKSGE